MIDFMKSTDSHPTLENFINSGKHVQKFNMNNRRSTEAFQTDMTMPSNEI